MTKLEKSQLQAFFNHWENAIHIINEDINFCFKVERKFETGRQYQTKRDAWKQVINSLKEHLDIR